jgi:hypothetical protein
LDTRIVVDHLIEADALVIDGGGERKSLDGVGGLFLLGGLNRIALAVGARTTVVVDGIESKATAGVDAIALLDVLEFGVQANRVVGARYRFSGTASLVTMRFGIGVLADNSRNRSQTAAAALGRPSTRQGRTAL